MVLNSLNDQRSEIAKNIIVQLRSWGLHTSQNIDEMCTLQYTCTIYFSRPEENIVVQVITDFNNVIDGGSCMDSFIKDELINLIELMSIEIVFISCLSTIYFFYLSKDELSIYFH